MNNRNERTMPVSLKHRQLCKEVCIFQKANLVPSVTALVASWNLWRPSLITCIPMSVVVVSSTYFIMYRARCLLALVFHSPPLFE